MSKDDSMEVRIAMLETKVDDLLVKVAELRRDMATKIELVDLQRQIEALKGEIARIDARLERIEERIGRLEERLARLEQRFESEFKQLATKADIKKEMLALALWVITIQTAINAAMISGVVQFLR